MSDNTSHQQIEEEEEEDGAGGGVGEERRETQGGSHHTESHGRHLETSSAVPQSSPDSHLQQSASLDGDAPAVIGVATTTMGPHPLTRQLSEDPEIK